MNVNLPKCTNCLKRGCDAGEVNHQGTIRGVRGPCLKCACKEFKLAPVDAIATYDLEHQP